MQRYTNNGMQWHTMAYNRIQWCATAYNRIQRYTVMVCNRTQWYTTVCNGIQWHTTVCNGIQPDCDIFATHNYKVCIQWHTQPNISSAHPSTFCDCVPKNSPLGCADFGLYLGLTKTIRHKRKIFND